jgi:hypothetical protein
MLATLISSPFVAKASSAHISAHASRPVVVDPCVGALVYVYVNDIWMKVDKIEKWCNIRRGEGKNTKIKIVR